MRDPAKFPATVGVFDPRGRLDRDRVLAQLGGALPDGSGVSYADPWFAVAAAPGTAADVQDDSCLLLDGRVENYTALARELDLAEGAAAHVVLRRANAQWPHTLVEHLRGAFVLAAWDASRRSGRLAVDQLARRSLVYAALPDGSLMFGSEIVLLLALLPTRPAPEPAGIAGWLLDHTVPYGGTHYAGIRRLGAARMLQLDPSGWREQRYWLPKHAQPFDDDPAELAEALWVQLTAAVDRKVDTDDRPAVILSGGLDSSAVTAAAAALAKHPPSTYSAVFPDIPDIDESPRIDAVIDFLDLDAVKLDLRPSGAVALALEYVDRWSLPLQGPGAAVEQPLVERAADQGATVILDGQSGDEIFDHSPFVIADRVRTGRILAGYSLAASLLPPDYTGLRKWRYAYRPFKIFGLQPAIPGRLHDALRRARGRERTLPAWFAGAPGTYDPAPPSQWLWKANDGPRWWAHQLFVSAQMRDRIGATDYLRHRAWNVGADARPPLLDVDLIEFILRLPPELGFHTPFPDRPVLREALTGRVPELVRTNIVKSNIAAFYYETLSGPDFASIHRLLTDGKPEIAAYVDLRHVDELLRRQPGVGNPGWYIWFASAWRLVTIEMWLRQEADRAFAARELESPDVIPTIRSDQRVRRRSGSSFFPTCDPKLPV